MTPPPLIIQHPHSPRLGGKAPWHALRALWLILLVAFGTLNAESSRSVPAQFPAGTYLFTGEQIDPDLGMYYLRARYYQPVIGRFWNMDSFEGSKETSVLSSFRLCWLLFALLLHCIEIHPDSGHGFDVRRLRPERGYSSASYDASPATRLKTLRRQFVRLYDEKKLVTFTA